MIQDIYNLTPLQEGILFHSLNKEIEQSPYFEQTSFEIHGEFDVEIFKKSWNHLIQRYDILRTVFTYKKTPKPKQVVLKQATIDLTYENITLMEDKNNYIQEFLEKDKQAYFGLIKTNPLRITVFQIEKNRYKIVFSFHHILLDGWSVGILFKELFEIYALLKKLQQINLAPTKPYSHYIKWLSKQDNITTKDFWKNYLSGYETHVQILQKTPSLEYIAKEETLIIDKNSTDTLHTLLKQHSITLNTFLETMWGVLMGKYNNSTDIVFGTTVSGRGNGLSGIENMVGLFINTIPLRVTFEQNETLESLVKKSMAHSIESKKHHHFPLVEIQSLTPLKNDLIKQLMVFESYPLQDSKYEEMGLEILHVNHFSQTNYDLNIIIFFADTIHIDFKYNSSLFEKNTIINIKNAFLKLISSFIQTPQMQISKIDILSDEEKSVLEGFNNIQKEYPKDKTIVELFQEQVLKNPNNVAVIYEDTQLTYEELNSKANTLANHLRELDITSDTLIPIMFDRSSLMIVAMLGVLKAGGAYLPIDSTYPESRIQYMMQDSGATLLVCDTKNAPIGMSYAKIIDIEKLDYTKKNKNLESINSASDLAYLIYTSGSTGTPKGCQLSHGNLVHLMKNRYLPYQFSQKDVWIMAHSYSFDFSVWEIYGALLFGGKLIVPHYDIVKDTKEFVKLIREKKVSVLNQTPLAFYQFIHEEMMYGDKDLEQHLRYVIFGGDKLNFSYLKPWSQKYPLIELINMYGITEVTIHATHHKITDREIENSTVSIIGKSLPDTPIYILDESQNQLPLGAIGEIYVGGESLARGYLYKEELTQKVFINHKVFGRIYKSGDLAKYHDDGNIEYLGRIDDQVKIRGFRIELGEIEKTILSYPSIKACVVIASNSQLVAYIVGEIKELKTYLKEKLPSYMVPSYFIQLEKLPLTPNGKVDKKALPKPSFDDAKEYKAPQTKTQKAIADIFKEVLHLEKVSIDDNFFEIGGHSLNAISVLSAINKKFSQDMKLSVIFKYATIEALAQIIEKNKPSKDVNQFYTVFNPDKKKAIFVFPTVIASIDHAFLERMSGFLSDYKIYAFDFITHEDRINQYANLVNTLQEEFVFFGYSSGGSLAFEVMKKLEELEFKQPNKFISFDSFIIDKYNSIEKEFRVLMLAKAREHGLNDYECQKIEIYMDMIDAKIDSGTIDIPIDFISNGESSKKEIQKSYAKWKLRTTKEVTLFYGFGEHDAMVKKDYLEKNCALIIKSLQKGGFKND